MDWLNLVVTALCAALPQMGLFLWWASSLATKTDRLEKDMIKLETQVDSMAKLEGRILVVESLLQTQTSVLREIRDEMRKTRTGD